MTRKRTVLIAAGSLAGLAAVLTVAAILVLGSGWFHGFVRQRMVDALETATGGRVAIGSFQFNWRRLRVEVRDFTLRGTEPAGKPPLLHAGTVAVGLKIVSVLGRKVDISSLEIDEPHVYLIVGPDGTTNLPEPKVKRSGGRDPVDTLLALAIGRFSVTRGVFEVESRGRYPFAASGRNLAATLSAGGAGRSYQGSVSVSPLEVHWGGQDPDAMLPVEVRAQFTLARNRIEIVSASLGGGQSRLEFSGAVENLASPAGSFRYSARVATADVSRFHRMPGLSGGWVELRGDGRWSGGSAYSLGGNLHAYGLEYRDRIAALRDIRAEAALEATSGSLALTGLRLSADAGAVGRADARVARAVLTGSSLDLESVDVAALGGSFHGGARLSGFDRFTAQGEIAGFLASRLVATYSRAPIPWDGRISGTVSAEGSLAHARQLRASATLGIAPEPGKPPIEGRIEAAWDGAQGVFDLGRSRLSLPSSRAEFSGALGRQMRVLLVTRDLNDLLPALGNDAAALPVHLENGSARFQGTVTGPLANPVAAGALDVTGLVYQGRRFTSIHAGVRAAPDNVSLSAGSAAQGDLRAQFQVALALEGWKANDASQIFGDVTVRNAAVAELAPLVGAANLPVTGTLSASARITGTLGNPLAAADVEITAGTVEEEPFSSFAGHITASPRKVDLVSGEISAGARRVTLAGGWEPGRVRFQVASNVMPLAEIHTLEKLRPGVAGTVQVTAAGTLLLSGAGGGSPAVRVADLNGDLAMRGVLLDGRPAGDVHLTASSANQVLRAHLESDFAGSSIRGDGQWRLDADYPGTATVTFSRVDFIALRSWVLPGQPGIANRFAGSAEGELRIQASLLRPQEAKAQLRIPSLELHPTGADGAPQRFSLHNAEPVAASLANRVITVDSAHFEGPSTDVRITGKASLLQKNPLDLRVNGRVDLALLQAFEPQVQSSGLLVADATVRGTFDDPQIGGRVQVQNAAINVADFPNGISNANGAIVFGGDRATVQSLSAETGGGKITFSGFAGFGGGELVFRLHARAEEVRVRYPEGVSTVADANLSLTGTANRSMLSGSVTVLRTGFNPQSDFSSVLAKSAEPVRTRSASTGVLGGMNFDIQIETSPDIQVQSSLTEDVGMEANLRLRGTFSNPALLGRVNITRGQLLFFGSKYNISQGSISFFNPVRVEPVLDIDLETKARGIEVTLNVSGPLNKLNLTPRSDPPLQFNEIVALLATGQAPTSDPAQLARQTSSPQPWQQSGAAALLGQAIASPVAGRLQRFFGVSRLRIDPTLPGVVYNPQARVTLEQQVTPEITFTYITVVTSSNPQVVSMEWDFSRSWSVVAVREENGLFGMDFFFKRRFK